MQTFEVLLRCDIASFEAPDEVEQQIFRIGEDLTLTIPFNFTWSPDCDNERTYDIRVNDDKKWPAFLSFTDQ